MAFLDIPKGRQCDRAGAFGNDLAVDHEIGNRSDRIEIGNGHELVETKELLTDEKWSIPGSTDTNAVGNLRHWGVLEVLSRLLLERPDHRRCTFSFNPDHAG